MKPLLISVFVLWALFQLSSLIWSSKGQPPSATFIRLLEAPQHRLIDPDENGYFYLLGFAAAASLDPAKIGHEMWLETAASPGASDFNYDKPGRSELRIELPLEQVLPSWNSENPVIEFRNTSAQFQTLTGRNRAFYMRYERWLTMPFEDMGFGHPGTPRFPEIFMAHRLYIADGFARQTALGMQRLKKDIHTWRNILQGPTTITTKVMAQIVIADDLQFLSTLLSQPAVDKTVLAMTPNIASPLSTAESSLRWPLQHQFILGVRGDHTDARTTDRQAEALNTQIQWLASAARLPVQAFPQIAHPHGRSLFGMPLQTHETWEMYAAYYDAMIQVTGTGQNTLPKLLELSGSPRQGIMENLFGSSSFKPDWNPFYAQLKETDARLRLASLQVVLRRPSAQTTVPNRLAEVGSSYYDPFSGLPMLWSATQQKIYSVGKDRFDDGGDTGFDISVPAIATLTPTPKALEPAAQTLRASRR
ncbi:MAG: hypothetical protein ABI980_04430 [Nitrospirota bacterium]